MNKKVSEIEFRIKMNEANDGILRAAELIKEGYNIYSIRLHEPELLYTEKFSCPLISLTLRKKEY